MSEHDWNAHYAGGDLPWDIGEPEPALVRCLEQADNPALRTQPRRALEIGCGTGTNALWLAQQGFDVMALDIAPLAIERARAKAAAQPGARCDFQQRDFVHGEPLQGSFQLVFDRGCFHVFEQASDQARFAERVAQVLVPGGWWLSLIGSTEGAPYEMGPPRRCAREILQALEPVVELVALQTVGLPPAPGQAPVTFWSCLSRRRTQPAQPSTRWADRV